MTNRTSQKSWHSALPVPHLSLRFFQSLSALNLPQHHHSLCPLEVLEDLTDLLVKDCSWPPFCEQTDRLSKGKHLPTVANDYFLSLL